MKRAHRVLLLALFLAIAGYGAFESVRFALGLGPDGELRAKRIAAGASAPSSTSSTSATGDAAERGDGAGNAPAAESQDAPAVALDQDAALGEPGEQGDEPEGGSDEPVLAPAPAADDGGGASGNGAATAHDFPGPRAAPRPPVIAREALASRIEALLGAKALKGGRIGISVVSAADGASLFEKNASEPLIVASNDKLFTTASALHHLGPAFEFTTRAYAKAGEFANGEVKGDLVIVGDGDPDPLDAAMSESASISTRLAAALVAAGVKRVTGDLVVDDHVFDRQYLPTGWNKDQLSHDYAAPVAGFSLLENCLTVRITPAAKIGSKAGVSAIPRCSLLAPQADVLTASAKAKNRIVIPAPVAAGKARVSGETPFGKSPVPLSVPLANPGETHPTALKEALARAGIEIAGKAVLAAARIDPTALKEIAAVRTPLTAVLRKVDKESSNVLAEHVYKRAGAALEGQGTFASGARAVLAMLSALGIDAAGATSADGSGLSRGNLFTAGQTAALLRVLHSEKFRAHVIGSLPIAGVDGTLSKRLTQPAYKGRVRAKTGYIAGVSALSGYAITDHGEVLCFSVLVNGLKGATAAKALQDGIAKLLVDVGPRAVR